MTAVRLEYHDYRYFPYERELARREVASLLAEPTVTDTELRVTATGDAPTTRERARRLTYVRAATIGGERVPTTQALLEASAAKGSARRQSTRYSAHGLHEYRGKFNPQIVRAALNLVGLEPRRARLWDPFCGSGTVLLEARHQGFDALGTDRNPMAVTIARAKLASVRASSRRLTDTTRALLARLASTSVKARHVRAVTLPNREYLDRWFPAAVQAQLRLVLWAIDEVAPPDLRPVYRVILSDVLRHVSWQDPGDLRIRRRKDPAPDYPALARFVEQTRKRIATVTAARPLIVGARGTQRAVLADCRERLPAPAAAFVRDGVDGVISSPPYATALPYIDTQRLSLALLGLATPAELRALEGGLVGSRELTTRARRALEDDITRNTAGLPDAVTRLCARLLAAVDPTRDGFRKRNTPGLMYRYFRDMKLAMTNVARALRPGGALVFVVGPNRTSLGDEEFAIDTPGLLYEIGAAAGLAPVELLELDTFHRFGLHARNSIREERMLIMRKRS